ncbi:MAG: IPT/TIG domain-containing protein, partial [Deltaproteobacteria bacterium]|nr:IPT/TIG domain-containing protein [Deltaproteobacteria bacterium]
MQGARTRWLGGARAVGWAAVVGAVWLAAACSEDGAPIGDGSSVSATIGPEGGSLALGDEVSLEIPPGALEAPTTITLSRTAEPAFEGWEAYSPVYRFEPEGLQFAVPAQVSIRFDGDPSRVELPWRADAADAPTEHVQTGVEGDRVLGEVSHFTLGLAGEDLSLRDLLIPECPTCPVISSTEPDPVRAGQTLTIRGLNLSNASSPFGDHAPTVRFGTVTVRPQGDPVRIPGLGTDDRPNEWGDTWIRVGVPPRAGKRIAVATDRGTSAAHTLRLLPFIDRFYARTALPGAVVAVEGSGFQAPSTSISGVPAETTELDETLLNLVVPDGATTGPLCVYTPIGEHCAAEPFTVGASPPGPQIGAVVPEAAPIGGQIEIWGTGFRLDAAGRRYGSEPAVTVGGVPALAFGNPVGCSTERCESNVRWRVLVSRGATDGEVVLTTPDGRARWSTFHVLPSISNVSPDHGSPGTEVVITGANLQRVGSVVFEPSAVAEVLSRSSEEIRAVVPDGFAGDELVLEAEHGQTRAPFRLDDVPIITSTSPSPVRRGEVLTVIGRRLRAAAFSFDAIPADAADTSSDPTTDEDIVTLPVPSSVPLGMRELRAAQCLRWGFAFCAEDATATRMVEVVAGPPALAAFAPTWGLGGTEVTLTGSDLAECSVRFGGLDAIVIERSVDRLVAVAPPDVATGDIVVENPRGERASIGPFVARAPHSPTITGLSPNRGRIGTRFYVEGTDLLDAEGNPGIVEMWPGVRAAVEPSWTSWICTEFGPCPDGCCARRTTSRYESTRLLVVVPAGAETGPVVVRTEGETTGPEFRVTRMWIASFAPDRGLVGSEVRFLGGGLEGARVEFTADAGGVEAIPVSSTDEQLGVQVPPGARSGPVTVIAADGERETPSEPFTVLEPAEPSIDYITPRRVRVGEAVYVVGANLDLGVAPTIRVGEVEVAARECWSECLGPYTHVVAGEPMGALSFAAPHTPVDGQVTVTTSFGTALGPRLALRPSIRFFDPLAAGPGDRVVAHGYRLGGATVTVSDGRREERALVLRTSDTEVEFVVPTELGRPSGISPSFGVTATVLYLPDTGPPVPMEDAASGLLPYSLSFPAVLTRVEPTSGRIGDEVVLEGDGIAGGRVLFFDGIEATIDSAESFFTPSGSIRTRLRVRVPEGATSGPLVVETRTGSVSNAVEFIVERSIDFTFAPDRGPGGTPVMIRGLPERLHVRVAFEGTAPVDAETVVRPEGGIDGYRVSVPANARTGPLRVDYQPLDRLSPWTSTTSATPFYVPPSVSALSPDNGLHGAVIDAYGLNLTGASLVTTVDGAVATPTVHSDTHISFAIPPSAAIGTGPIAVTTPTGSSLSSVELTVLPPPSRLPTITSFSPDATTVGELV